MGKIRGMKEVFTTAQGVVKRLVSAGDMHPGVNVRSFTDDSGLVEEAEV